MNNKRETRFQTIAILTLVALSRAVSPVNAAPKELADDFKNEGSIDSTVRLTPDQTNVSRVSSLAEPTVNQAQPAAIKPISKELADELKNEESIDSTVRLTPDQTNVSRVPSLAEPTVNQAQPAAIKPISKELADELKNEESIVSTVRLTPDQTNVSRVPSLAEPTVNQAQTTAIKPIPSATVSESISDTNSEQPEPVGSILPVDLDSDQLGQVTSVSQLSDVQPEDWAFQAIQSLVERYGCLAGYSDSSLKPSRSISRREAAALVNACINNLSNRFATNEDLDLVKALQDEFAAELATLRGRVDSLEAQLATVEAQQFSTTTKIQGEAIFSGIVPSGGASDQLTTFLDTALGPALGTTFSNDDTNPFVSYRVRLNLTTSFTGKDTLITGLQSFNFEGGLLGGNGLQDALFPGSVLNSGSANVSFSPQFAGVDPQNLASTANDPINVQLYKLLYVFPVSDKVSAFVFPKAETTDAFPQVLPWSSESQGALSRFARVNPVVRQSGGTSGDGLASGLGFIWNPSGSVNLTALYGSVSAPLATGDLASGNALGSGFFPSDSSSYIAAAQLTLKPTDQFDAALNFAFAQHNLNILGTGLASPGVGGLLGLSGGDVFALPGVDLGQRVQVVGLGGTLTYRLSPKVALSAYGAGFFVDNAAGGLALLPALGGVRVPTNTEAGAVYTSFLGGIHFNDLLMEGDSTAIIAGQPLFPESTSGAAFISPSIPGVFEFARPFHIEGYYRFKVNDNISVTPGVFAVFNPESNSENSTAIVGVIRTTFSF